MSICRVRVALALTLKINYVEAKHTAILLSDRTTRAVQKKYSPPSTYVMQVKPNEHAKGNQRIDSVDI